MKTSDLEDGGRRQAREIFGVVFALAVIGAGVYAWHWLSAVNDEANAAGAAARSR